MSVRPATRTLTGRTPRAPMEVVLGTREDGRPGVTLLPRDYRDSLPFDNPEHLEELMEDLQAAIRHLRGETQ